MGSGIAESAATEGIDVTVFEPKPAPLDRSRSSIPIAEIGSWTQRPERVVGLHFLSPVPVMKLVEVVVALDTAEATVARAEEFVTVIGRQPIGTEDRSGSSSTCCWSPS